MEDYQYFTIPGWVVEKLNLGDFKEIGAYSIIYSYYRSGISEVNASLKYFAHILHCSERTVSTILSNLSKRGLISKTSFRARDGSTRNTYRINYQILVDKGIMTTEDDNPKAEKPKNFNSKMQNFPSATETNGKNFNPPHEKFADNIYSNYNNSLLNLSSHSISEENEKVKKIEEKSEKNEKTTKEKIKDEIPKRTSYQEALKEIGVSSGFINAYNIRNENSLKDADADIRNPEFCNIPYSFRENKKAIEYALKYMSCYSYCINNDYTKYSEYADAVIACMSELASDTYTRVKGQTVKYYEVIDRLNEINQTESGLTRWISVFGIFWKKILKEKLENGEEIRYKKAFMKSCIWDYMNRPAGLW